MERIVNNFIDREDSWLDFNERVLYQAYRKDIPYPIRIQFIGIASSNLDEFISVRYSGLDDSNPEKNKFILERIKFQKNLIMKAFEGLKINLNGTPEEYNTQKMVKLFNTQIYPALTPLAISSNKEVPRFSDKDLNFLVLLEDDNGKKVYCFLQIPNQLDRIYYSHNTRYSIESIVSARINEMFNKRTLVDMIQFTVNKKYSEEIIHDSDASIINKVKKVLQHREENNIVFLDIITYGNKSNKLVKYLTKFLKVPKGNVAIFEYNQYRALGLHFLSGIKVEDTSGEPELPNEVWNKDFKPKTPSELEGTDLYEYIEDSDLIIHNPYEEYLVPQFINEAANDPNTLTIKQTLYRVSGPKSPIIKSLCKAAKRGVNVTVMLELLARFDEKRNISLIKKLKKAGVTIVYSLESLKTHCKMCLITKSTKNGIKTYSHVGTGNYNEKTANIYTDISFFTTKASIAGELNSVFNMITGFSNPGELSKIFYSPDTLRANIEDNIRKCTEYIDNGGAEAFVKIKVNSISDDRMVKLIYETAKKYPTIRFQIICRGICSLPALPNIQIHSIVGRFLEHSRIYIFQYDGREEVYISSADLLTRNLDKRVELMLNITDKNCRNKINDIFNILIKDTANTWILNEKGYWEKIKNANMYSAQNALTM